MKVGSLWRGKPGGPVATGTINILGQDIKIYVWKNDKKERETQPDLIISVRPKEEPVNKTFPNDIPF